MKNRIEMMLEIQNCLPIEGLDCSFCPIENFCDSLGQDPWNEEGTFKPEILKELKRIQANKESPR